MDFSFNDEQTAVREAADGILCGLVDPDRVGEVEATEDRVDRALWVELAKADLLGLAVPSADGGGSYGMVELCLLLEAQGKVVAPVPLWATLVLATLVLGALPVAEFGSYGLRAALLPGVTAGDVILTAALADVADDIAVGGTGHPSVSAAVADDGTLTLEGIAHAVPYAHLADRVLVPAATPDGVVVAVIDPTSAGVSVERATTTNREIHPHLHLDGVTVAPGEVLAGGDAGRGAEVLDWMLERAWTGLCALQVGIAEAAVRQTAEYLNTRKQFGLPLATFQATKMRAADAAIDTDAIRVTTWQAAWRLDNGLDAARAVNVASWFASESGQRVVFATQHLHGGQRVVFATQHLHGGMGADISYPIHRYFLWGKQIELQLGSPSAQLARLGRQVTADLEPASAGAGKASV
jgi:alkylation response protein AidB-like acyl-CoA dehydrogenase